MEFYDQFNGLRKLEEAKKAILAFTRYANSPWEIRRRPSYLTLQTMTDIPPCTNLLGLGKEYSAFQAAWRKGRPSLNDNTFVVRGISRVRMAHLKQGPFMLKGCVEISVVGGRRGRGKICSSYYYYFSRLLLSQWRMLSDINGSVVGGVGDSRGPYKTPPSPSTTYPVEVSHTGASVEKYVSSPPPPSLSKTMPL